eukprot:129702-Hanusia_phi.AAC.1
MDHEREEELSKSKELFCSPQVKDWPQLSLASHHALSRRRSRCCTSIDQAGHLKKEITPPSSALPSAFSSSLPPGGAESRLPPVLQALFPACAPASVPRILLHTVANHSDEVAQRHFCPLTNRSSISHTSLDMVKQPPASRRIHSSWCCKN